MKLPRLGVRRPVLTAMIFLAILVIGLVSLTRLSLDLMPEIEPPSISVSTNWAGASAEDVEAKVTRVIENNLSIVSNLEELRSTTREGSSSVTCKFKWGTNLDEASNDIRDRLEFAKRRLPEDVDEPTIYKFNTSMTPIVHYGVTAQESWERLADLVNDEVADPLKRLPGVGAVQVFGGLDRQISVHLDRARLAGYGLTLAEVETVLRAENLTLPAGTINIGRTEYTIRVPGEYAKPADIRDIVLRRSRGAIVYLRDVAEVEDGFREQTRQARVNGRPGIMMMVQKRSGANTVEVARAVRQEIEAIQRQLPPDVELTLLSDSSEFITRSVRNVTRTVAFGGLFVGVVTFLFLRQVRTSVIILLTIPFSLIIAFAFMFFMGWTLNLMSLMSLAVAIGMVVDSAVVILENIVSHVERGEKVNQAAVFGSQEVGTAIMASTLTTVVVFAPLVFITGVSGVMFKQLGGIVSATLLASLLCALMLTPMLCSKLLRPASSAVRRGPWGRLYAVSERGFLAVEAAYGRLLGRALRHRGIVLLVAVACLAGAAVLVPLIGTEFAPEEDSGEVRLSFQLPVGTRVEETAKVCERIEALGLEVAGAQDVERSSWRCGSGAGGSGHSGSVNFKLVPQLQRARSAKEIARALADRCRDWPELVKVQASSGGSISGRLLGGGRPVSIEVLGHNLSATEAIARQIQQIAEGVPGSRDVVVSRDLGKPELVVRVDRQKAASLGLNITTVAESLRTLFYGKEATQFRQAENDYQIFMRLREAQRASIEDIRQAEVVIPGPRRIRLDAIATVEEAVGPVEIERKNQQRVVRVGMDTFGRTTGQVVADIRAAVEAEVALPAGVSIFYAGMAQEQQRSFRDMGLMLALGVILVFMVMAAQFESLRDPFVVMFSVPFAFTGVAAALAITGTSLNVMSYIGVILLVGTAVNNAIVLVDYTNILRARGQSLSQAVANAGRQRLRPVLMTSLTTMCGMLPMATGRGEGAEFWRPLGIAVIGGLCVSTLVTLVLVPTVYSLFQRRDRE